MDKPVVSLSVNEQNMPLDVHTGSLGKPVAAIKPIMDAGLFTLDPGFFVTASCQSSITFIDGQAGILLHRGYAIDDLAQHSDYMELCHLLLKGQLPTAEEKNNFIHTIKQHGQLQQQVTQFFNGFKRDAHPMSIMVGVVGALSAFYPQHPDTSDSDYQMDCALQLIAKIPVIAAMAHKHTSDQAFVSPNNELGFAENFLQMMFSSPSQQYQADPIIIKAMDRIFMLHADHEQNASTTAVRVSGSTGANPFACIAAGIATLWGPAHGGANEACLNMLEQIGSTENIKEYLERAKDKDDPFRLMGFGHRVYKNYDPRAKVMRETCHEVLDAVGAHDDPIFKLAMQLEKIAREDDYFVKRNLYPNVDFYSGITLRALGIPTNMFTVIFALARSIGWISHWVEMMNDPQARLARPRQLYIGETQRPVPAITERQTAADDNT